MEAVYLKSQGPLHKEICRLSRISENTLRSYPRRFREGGVERLKRLDLAKPRSQLTDHREPSEDYCRKDPPRSAAQAAADIARITGIRRGLTRVRKSLEGIGLRLRKVGMIPAEADAEAQRRSLDEQLWPRLRRARRLHRVVRFVDAAHFVHGPFPGYLWRFMWLLIRGPSGRRRSDVLGAIDAVTHQLTTVTNIATIDAESVRELLRAVRGRPGSLPVTLVLDNARYRRCEVVEQGAKRLRIESLDLPSYSPNSNPIERLWKFVEGHCCTEMAVAEVDLQPLPTYATRSLSGIPRRVMMFKARPRIAPSVTWHSSLRLAR